MNKVDLRRQALANIGLISISDKQQKSLQIEKLLKKHLKHQSGFWAGFMALSTEPQINWYEVSETIQWCFPVITGNVLSFKKEVTQFTKHALGFLEPQDGTIVSIEKLSGAVIPGVAFDQSGYRLGRGQGFYDQTVKNYKGFLIGVCFETAFVNSVPIEAHDLKCQMIITENQSVVIEGVNSWN